jgi:hypothetical protein
MLELSAFGYNAVNPDKWRSNDEVLSKALVEGTARTVVWRTGFLRDFTFAQCGGLPVGRSRIGSTGRTRWP